MMGIEVPLACHPGLVRFGAGVPGLAGRLGVATSLLMVFHQNPFPRDPVGTGFSSVHFPEVVICEYMDLVVENMPSLRYQKKRFLLAWYRGP